MGRDNHIDNSGMLWLCCLLIWAGMAAMPADLRADEIRVLSASTTLQNDVYQLDAQIEFQLHAELIEALHNSVVLPVSIEIEFYLPRGFWLDTELARLEQHYELKYHALSKQYVLSNLNSGATTSYGTLDRALDALGTLRSLPLIDHDLVGDTPSRVRIRAGIETNKLAIPLRLLSYVYSEWRAQSDWYDWPL